MIKTIRSQNGFTLVEILIVLAIISLLFLLIIPEVNGAVLKARETGVKTDFRDFQTATESLMRETLGKSLTQEKLNHYLDKHHEIIDDGTGLLQTKSKDPWHNSCAVEITNGKVLFYSGGKEEDFRWQRRRFN